jgi:7-carboxy-7-deazaguanine synthase
MLQVNEIFHSIQGEGRDSGRPCTFIRLTGCNLRCGWCDTAYAFHDGEAIGIDQILETVDSFNCRLVELTGGEPLLQEEAPALLKRLLAEGYELLLETGGGVSIQDVPESVGIILDIKCPGSGEERSNTWSNLDILPQGSQVKLVIRDRDDFQWALKIIRDHDLDSRFHVLMSPVRGVLDAADLAAWILECSLQVRLQIQLHSFLWPDRTRGY